jgi:hypothetical protein
MAQIEKLERALEELVYLFFTDLVRRQEFMQIEVGESAIGDAGRKEFPQAARIDGTQLANFFEDYAAQGILEDRGIEQFADFSAGSALNQDRAQKAQRVPFE